MEKSNSVIEYFSTIESGFRRMKLLVWMSLGFAALISLGAIFLALNTVSGYMDRVYILDRGVAMSAFVDDASAYRDLEVVDHVERFHELLFRLSPSKQAIERNVDAALLMCDKSAYDFWRDLSEKGYYLRLVEANISQDFTVDSVLVDVAVYPYKAKLFGKMYLLRESNITAYEFISSCQLVDVQRSSGNPHGLMMEKFVVERNEKMESRKRY